MPFVDESRRVVGGFGAVVSAGADNFGTSGDEPRRPLKARTVITVAAPTATSKPPCAPPVSTTRPATAAAPAVPAALAELPHVNAWVRTARGTDDSVRREVRISRTGTARPVRARVAPTAKGALRMVSGRLVRVRQAAAAAWWRRGE